MAYSKHRYKSRRDRYARIKRNTKIILIGLAIFIAILIFKNRVYLWDMVKFYF